MSAALAGAPDRTAIPRAEMTAPTRRVWRLKRPCNICTHPPWCGPAAELSLQQRPLALRPWLTPGLPFSVGLTEEGIGPSTPLLVSLTVLWTHVRRPVRPL